MPKSAALHPTAPAAVWEGESCDGAGQTASGGGRQRQWRQKAGTSIAFAAESAAHLLQTLRFLFSASLGRALLRLLRFVRLFAAFCRLRGLRALFAFRHGRTGPLEVQERREGCPLIALRAGDVCLASGAQFGDRKVQGRLCNAENERSCFFVANEAELAAARAKVGCSTIDPLSSRCQHVIYSLQDSRGSVKARWFNMSCRRCRARACGRKVGDPAACGMEAGQSCNAEWRRCRVAAIPPPPRCCRSSRRRRPRPSETSIPMLLP